MCINYCSDLRDEFLDKKLGHVKSSSVSFTMKRSFLDDSLFVKHIPLLSKS